MASNDFYATRVTFLARVQTLAATTARAEREVLDFLLAGEAHTHLWAGFRTYDSFVAAVVPSVGRRFRDWARVVKQIPARDVTSIGVNGAIELLRVDPARRAKAVADLKAWIKTRQLPITPGEARRIINTHRDIMPRKMRSKQELLEANDEIERLRKRVAALEAENKVLKTECRVAKRKAA